MKPLPEHILVDFGRQAFATYKNQAWVKIMVMKRRAFLAASAATLGASPAVSATGAMTSDLKGADLSGSPGPSGPGLQSYPLAAGQVTVSGTDGVSSYLLSTTENVREELIEIFDEALAQLPAHIEFGPGDLHLAVSGIEVTLPKGERGLSLTGNGTRFRLTGPSQLIGYWHCLRLAIDASNIDLAGGAVMPAEDYFSDLSIDGITFYDDDPVAHSDQGVEETHGLNLQWVRNAKVTNCTIDNVGDEGIELDYCENVVVSNNCLINTTQVEFSGGGAISIKNGCENISLLANTIENGGGFETYGIAIKVINPVAVRNITIAGNTISNMVTNAIDINIAGNGNNTGIELLNNVSISANVFDGAFYGIGFSGGGSNDHLGRGITISNNVFSGHNSGGIRMFSNKFSGVSISNNVFGDISGVAILANGEGFVLSNNEMTNIEGACILLFSGAGASIAGGFYRGCGANANALFDEAIGFTDVSISDVRVLDCKAPIVVKNIRHISGCVMEADSAGAVQAPNMIDIGIEKKGPASITNNSLRQGCIRVAAEDSVISGNNIVHSRDPGADAVRILSGASNCLISGNHVAAFANRFAISIAGNDAVVTGNHVAKSGSPISNAASGTLLAANKGNEANETGPRRMNPGG